MAKKNKHVCPAGLPAWLVTYGDMMSLLLTFFILLFSFSSVNASKFSKVVVSLKGALGVLSGGEQLLVDGTSPHSRESKGEQTYMELQGAAFRLEEELKNMNMESEAAVVLDKRGLVVMVASSLLFEPNSVKIRDAAKPLLIRLAELIASFPNLVRVEGHAARVPGSSAPFPSNNWELAAGRASSVVRYFIEREPIIAPRLTVVSYGDLHPIAPNDTKANRAKNRRVEIVFERFREEEEG